MILIAKAAHIRYGGCRSCSETFQKFATLVILEHVVNRNAVFLHAESHIAQECDHAVACDPRQDRPG